MITRFFEVTLTENSLTTEAFTLKLLRKHQNSHEGEGKGGNNSPHPWVFCCWPRSVLAQHRWVPFFMGQAGFGPALMIFVGKADSGPTFMSGLGLAQTQKGKVNCWAEIGPTLLGLSLAQLVGWPSPAHLILYIIYYNVFILFINIDI